MDSRPRRVPAARLLRLLSIAMLALLLLVATAHASDNTIIDSKKSSSTAAAAAVATNAAGAGAKKHGEHGEQKAKCAALEGDCGYLTEEGAEEAGLLTIARAEEYGFLTPTTAEEYGFLLTADVPAWEDRSAVFTLSTPAGGGASTCAQKPGAGDATVAECRFDAATGTLHLAIYCPFDFVAAEQVCAPLIDENTFDPWALPAPAKNGVGGAALCSPPVVAPAPGGSVDFYMSVICAPNFYGAGRRGGGGGGGAGKKGRPAFKIAGFPALGGGEKWK